jgi:hypothetical protein
MFDFLFIPKSLPHRKEPSVKKNIWNSNLPTAHFDLWSAPKRDPTVEEMVAKKRKIECVARGGGKLQLKEEEPELPPRPVCSPPLSKPRGVGAPRGRGANFCTKKSHIWEMVSKPQGHIFGPKWGSDRGE